MIRGGLLRTLSVILKKTNAVLGVQQKLFEMSLDENIIHSLYVLYLRLTPSMKLDIGKECADILFFTLYTLGERSCWLKLEKVPQWTAL